MKHEFEQKVYYADTDAYGVVWHGSYIRWMEAGRCMWCEAAGQDLIDLEKNHDIVLPVVNLNVRYKLSAKLGDIIIIETDVEKFNGLSATFKQAIKNSAGKVLLEAGVEIVAISSSTGKLYRKMPEILADTFVKELTCRV
ncbi:MAG: acyl-CoA thioesterase [Heliobacteriaceae bacterium]|jgi:acyl-CoA thioester hydrolase|nr:acyl-CoA thioesterase [Heliobacteriaceae bacterium]